jgi:hypothetical protein
LSFDAFDDDFFIDFRNLSTSAKNWYSYQKSKDEYRKKHINVVKQANISQHPVKWN